MGTLWITANSPGEIAGWLRPVARRLLARRPDLELRVLLLPCTFASGFEEKVAHAIPGVTDVVPVSEFGRVLKQSDGPRGLLHLGGDLMYAAFLVRKFAIPAWGYQWARGQWDRYFRSYLVKTDEDRDRLVRQGIAPAKVHVVGDLVMDSVTDQVALTGEKSAGLVTFLPGSRMREARVLLPFFLEVASRVRKELPDTRFQAMLSPFLPWDQMESTLPPEPRLGGIPVSVEADNLMSADGTSLRIVRSLEHLATSDLAVTIPGTKTAEAACLGVPSLVVMPLNLPEDIPSIGLVGLLDYLPLIGRHVKGFFVTRMIPRLGYLAQPNILARREVVPELKGHLSPALVAERVLHLLRERHVLVEMAAELRTLYEPFVGAADRLVDVILADLGDS